MYKAYCVPLAPFGSRYGSSSSSWRSIFGSIFDFVDRTSVSRSIKRLSVDRIQVDVTEVRTSVRRTWPIQVTVTLTAPSDRPRAAHQVFGLPLVAAPNTSVAATTTTSATSIVIILAYQC